eukprot:1156227-Pelagomonas_calceolata.AAC.13
MGKCMRCPPLIPHHAAQRSPHCAIPVHVPVGSFTRGGRWRASYGPLCWECMGHFVTMQLLWPRAARRLSQACLYTQGTHTHTHRVCVCLCAHEQSCACCQHMPRLPPSAHAPTTSLSTTNRVRVRTGVYEGGCQQQRSHCEDRAPCKYQHSANKRWSSQLASPRGYACTTVQTITT